MFPAWHTWLHFRKYSPELSTFFARLHEQPQVLPADSDQTSDPLIIQGIADSSAKFATATADGCLYAVFNGIWSRQTSYFTVPSGTLSIMGCGTAEGTQRFKVAVWKKVDGGAEYVTDSTYYIHTDGTDYRCTISGLDPAAQYRVTISYDSSKYYLYGLLKVEGIG